jgi:hypothetical protein
MTTKAEIDPLIGRTSLAGLTAAYLYGADLRAPLARRSIRICTVCRRC